MIRGIFILTLLAFWMESCGIKKTYRYDRFGGGVINGKEIQSKEHIVIEKQFSTQEKMKSVQIQQSEIISAAEVCKDTEYAGLYFCNLPQSSLMCGDKKILNAWSKINTGIKITKLKNYPQEQPKAEGDKSRKWSRILANSALILLLLGLISLLLFPSESDFTGIALLLLFWLLALVLLLTALVLGIIGSSKRKKRMAG